LLDDLRLVEIDRAQRSPHSQGFATVFENLPLDPPAAFEMKGIRADRERHRHQREPDSSETDCAGAERSHRSNYMTDPRAVGLGAARPLSAMADP
jgi:hypothetical protein